jgi:AAA+ ATPase superfamily predicted ATPase
MSKLVGRIPELKNLNEALENDKPELIALYGRRRIGKTYLIRQFYGDNIVFEVTGLHGGNMKDQLTNFNKEVSLHYSPKHSIF